MSAAIRTSEDPFPTAPTKPRASTAHDALVIDIAHRLQALSKLVAETLTMSHEDRGDALGLVIDEFDHERGRVDSARSGAYRQAAAESAAEQADAAEDRWNAAHNSGMP